MTFNYQLKDSANLQWKRNEVRIINFSVRLSVCFLTVPEHAQANEASIFFFRNIFFDDSFYLFPRLIRIKVLPGHAQ